MLLKKNKVEIKSKEGDFTKSDFSAYIVQKENKNLFGLLPRIWVYYKTKGEANRKILNWINKNIGKEPIYYSNNSREKTASEKCEKRRNK